MFRHSAMTFSQQFKYRAFISYSHAADGKLAPALQSALHRFAKPWYRLRAMRVFRDKTSLAMTPELWPSIKRALSESEYFLLLASPQAKKSQWVQQEVEWWCDHRSSDTLFIVLTDGDVSWNRSAGDFDQTTTTSLPPNLQGRFKNEPLHVDLRWARTEEKLSLRHSRFRAAILDIASPLLGKPKDELDGEDVHQARIVKRLSTGVVMTIATLAVIAVWQWQEADLRRDEAVAKELAARSQVLVDQRGVLLDTAALLAVEAMRRHPSIETDQAIRKVLAILPRVIVTMDCAGKGEVEDAVFSHDGRYLATTSTDGAVRIFATADGKVQRSVEVGPVTKLLMRPRLDELLVLDAIGNARIFSLGIGTQGDRQLPQTGVVAVAYSANGDFLVTASDDHTIRLWDAHSLQEIWGKRHDDLIHSVSVSPDASELLAWNNNVVHVMHGPGEPAQELNVNGPMKMFYNTDGTHVQLAMVNTMFYQFHLFDVPAHHALVFDKRHWDLTFSRDGTSMAVASPEWFAEAYDIRSCYEAGQSAEPLSGGTIGFKSIQGFVSCRRSPLMRHDDSVKNVALSPDGLHLGSTSRDGTARVWNTWRGREVLRILEGTGTSIQELALPVDKHLVSGWGRTGCRTWERTGHRDAFSFELKDGVSALAFSPNSKVLAVTGKLGVAGQGPVHVLDLETQQEITRFLPPSEWPILTKLEFDDAGKRLLMNERLIWNFALDNKVIGQPDRDSIHEISMDRRWHTQARLSHGQEVLITDTTNDATLARRDFRETIDQIHLTPDGCCVLVITMSGTVLWHWRDDRLDTLEDTIPSEITYTEFDPTGRQLALVTGKGHRVVQIWNILSKPSRVTSLEHEGEVTAATFDPTGTHVVTAGRDRSARIWQLHNGTVIAQLSHEDDVTTARFSSDGKYVASGGGRSDRWVRVWLWHPHDLIRETCARLHRQLTPAEWKQYLGHEQYRETCPHKGTEATQ